MHTRWVVGIQTMVKKYPEKKLAGFVFRRTRGQNMHWTSLQLRSRPFIEWKEGKERRKKENKKKWTVSVSEWWIGKIKIHTRRKFLRKEDLSCFRGENFPSRASYLSDEETTRSHPMEEMISCPARAKNCEMFIHDKMPYQASRPGFFRFKEDLGVRIGQGIT